MCPTVHGLGFVHCGQIAWKKWPTNWHAHVSRWLMLSCHWQLWVLLPMCLFDYLLVFSFVGFGLVRGREGRYTRVNVFYSSYTSPTIWGFFFLLFFCFFFLRLGLGQRRAVVIIGRWLLPSLVDTGDICCHYWQHILVHLLQCLMKMLTLRKVDAQVKLTQLLQYTSGRAKSAIKNCSFVGGEQGYQQARNILKERFGNDYLVSQKIQSQLKSGKPIRKSDDLQQLADDLSIASATLGKMSTTSEIGNQHSIVSILERCPQYVQNKCTKKALKHKRENSVYPGFDSLVWFMNEVATEACDPVFGHDGKMSKGAKVKSDMTSGSYVTTVTSTSESNTVNPVHTSSSPKGPCVLCAQNHRLFACDAFRAMGPQERFGVVKNYKLCFNCLMSGHRAYKCKKQSVCSVPVCGKKHSKFIHVDPVPQPPAVPQVTNTSNLSAGISGAGNNGAHAAGNNGNMAASGNVSSVSANCHKGNAYLPIVPVIVNDCKLHRPRTPGYRFYEHTDVRITCK